MVGASSLQEFGDFDDGKIYESCYGAALRGDTQNFVIEFDSTKAYAAQNLSDASITQLLRLEVNEFCLSHSRNQRQCGIYTCCSKIEC